MRSLICQLLDGMLDEGLTVNGFPMHESYDVGTPDDYKEVQSKS